MSFHKMSAVALMRKQIETIADTIFNNLQTSESKSLISIYALMYEHHCLRRRRKNLMYAKLFRNSVQFRIYFLLSICMFLVSDV